MFPVTVLPNVIKMMPQVSLLIFPFADGGSEGICLLGVFHPAG